MDLCLHQVAFLAYLLKIPRSSAARLHRCFERLVVCGGHDPCIVIEGRRELTLGDGER